MYIILFIIMIKCGFAYMFGCSVVLLCIGSSPGDDIYKEWEVESAWGKKVKIWRDDVVSMS